MEENVQLEKQTEIQVIANNINAGLKAFEERKEELIQLKDRVAGLTIESIDDKAAIAEVATARKTLKKARVEIEKEGKSMRDPLTKISKSISEKQYELIDIISPTEKDLQAKEDWVKAEQDKIEQAEAARKQSIIQGRIDALAAYGFAIDITFLTGIDDEQFQKVLGNARTEFEKEQAAKAEAERLEQEKKAQIERDLADLKALRAKQEEADRIIKERQDELDRQAAQQRKKEEEIAEADRKRLQTDHDNKMKSRAAQLSALGLRFDFSDNHYKNFGCFVAVVDIQTSSEDDWGRLIAEITPVIDKFKREEAEKAEAKRLVDLDKARQQAIAEEQERHRKEVEKEAEDRRLADILKQEELEKAGDKAKWADFIEKLSEIQVPTMRSNQYRRLAAIARGKTEEIQKLKP